MVWNICLRHCSGCYQPTVHVKKFIKRGIYHFRNCEGSFRNGFQSSLKFENSPRKESSVITSRNLSTTRSLKSFSAMTKDNSIDAKVTETSSNCSHSDHLHENDLLRTLNDSNLSTNVHPSIEKIIPKSDIDLIFHEQFKNEANDCVFIPKFFKKDIDKTSLELLSDLEQDWRSNMTTALNDKLSQESIEEFDVKIIPYLNSVRSEYIVNYLMSKLYWLPIQNLKSRIYRSNLVYQMGIEFHHISLRSYDQKNFSKIYTDYCHWYNDRPNSTRPTCLPRIQWLNLREKVNKTLAPLPWTKDVHVALGTYLLSLLQMNIRMKSNQGKITRVLKLVGKNDEDEATTLYLTPVFKALFKNIRANYLILSSSRLPMLSPPVPWISTHHGGYLTPQIDLIRMTTKYGRFFEYLDKMCHCAPDPVMDSVNAIASVPWKINGDILEIISELMETDGWTAFDLESNKEDRTEMSPREYESHVEKSRWRYIDRKKLISALSIAKMYKDRVFWFPHNIDFRGRCYPTAVWLQYQQDDIFQSLLTFAQGKKLGPQGLNWLKIHLANLTEVKKHCTLEERLSFVDENLEQILDSGNNPVNGNRWWKQFHERWRVLAACKEIADAMKCSNPEDFLSHLPVYQDGSCNAMQHFAALSLDSKAATSVNLCSSPKPQDIYQDVSDEIERRRILDAATEAGENKALAKTLEGGFVTRKVFKQTILRTLYGTHKSTYTAPKHIAKELERMNFPYENLDEAALYLNDLLYDSFHDRFVPVKQLRDWFTECTKTLVSCCPHLVNWKNPMGLTVVQPYHNLKEEQNNQFTLDEDLCVKHVRAFLPNFIHSLESSHLMLTSLSCQEVGVTFIGNHDSFWTHAGHVACMNKICREQFINLYSQPILENLVEEFQGRIDRSDQPQKLKEIPKKGDFDLKNVISSTYFFN